MGYKQHHCVRLTMANPNIYIYSVLNVFLVMNFPENECALLKKNIMPVANCYTLWMLCQRQQRSFVQPQPLIRLRGIRISRNSRHENSLSLKCLISCRLGRQCQRVASLENLYRVALLGNQNFPYNFVTKIISKKLQFF